MNDLGHIAIGNFPSRGISVFRAGGRRFFWSCIVAAAASLAVHAAWIPLKAQVAQWLLRDTWREIRAGNVDARPWPWADTRPVAVLSVPALGIEQFVLEGNSGRNLAFGPVVQNSTAAGRDWVLSAHRDTHFRFLGSLQPGDLIRLETTRGVEEFAVDGSEIVDSRRKELVLEPALRRLSLVTCYPFDSPVAGSPLRFVVTALPRNAAGSGANPLPSASG